MMTASRHLPGADGHIQRLIIRPICYFVISVCSAVRAWYVWMGASLRSLQGRKTVHPKDMFIFSIFNPCLVMGEHARYGMKLRSAEALKDKKEACALVKREPFFTAIAAGAYSDNVNLAMVRTVHSTHCSKTVPPSRETGILARATNLSSYENESVAQCLSITPPEFLISKEISGCFSCGAIYYVRGR